MHDVAFEFARAAVCSKDAQNVLKLIFARTLFSHRNSSTTLSLVCMVVEVGSDFKDIWGAGLV